MADFTQTFDLAGLNADQTLDALIEVRQAIDWLKARDASLLDRLDELAEAGEIDQGGFSHNDWRISWSAGRRSWTSPAAVQALDAQLKTTKKAAEADGSATAAIGDSFWTLTPPKP